MDLSSFADLTKAQDDGIDVHILDPRGNETDIVIRVAGPDSERQRRARAQVNNERLRSGRNKPLTTAEVEQMNIRVAVASVISWQNVTENGAPVEFSAEAATDIFKRYPFILEQINDAIGDRAGFIKT